MRLRFILKNTREQHSVQFYGIKMMPFTDGNTAPMLIVGPLAQKWTAYLKSLKSKKNFVLFFGTCTFNPKEAGGYKVDFVIEKGSVNLNDLEKVHKQLFKRLLINATYMSKSKAKGMVNSAAAAASSGGS